MGHRREGRYRGRSGPSGVRPERDGQRTGDTHRGAAGSTRAAILTEAIRQAAESGLGGIRISTVLANSHASSSSLYHHFGNREGLIRAVEAERLRDGLLEEDASLLQTLDQIGDPEEFCSFVADQVRRLVTDLATVERRRHRLEAVVAGFASPAAADEAAHQIGLLHRAITVFMQAAIDRDLCNPALEARAYAVFLTSLSLGQMASGATIDDEAWLSVAIPAAIAPLRH